VTRPELGNRLAVRYSTEPHFDGLSHPSETLLGGLSAFFGRVENRMGELDHSFDGSGSAGPRFG
jgi:hypothetical protein